MLLQNLSYLLHIIEDKIMPNFSNYSVYQQKLFSISDKTDERFPVYLLVKVHYIAATAKFIYNKYYLVNVAKLPKFS